MVTKKAKTQIFSGVATTSLKKLESLMDEGDETCKEDGEEPCAPTCLVSLCPWENPEQVFSEMYNLFMKLEGADCVIDLSAGSGMACLAAARLSIPYVGFVHCEEQATLIRETVWALMFVAVFRPRCCKDSALIL